MRDLRALGAGPTVLAPERILGQASWNRGLLPGRGIETRDEVTIRRPWYLPFSNKTLPWGGSTFRWTVASFDGAVLRAARSVKTSPQICYGHFLYPAGHSARRLAQRLGVPSVVALGEGSFDHYERYFGLDRVRADLASFSRVLAASEAIKDICVHRYRVPESRIGVFPNAAASHFYPRPRDEMRRKLGLPADRPIIAFVGHFNDNKGPRRVLEAIESRPEIGAIFLGQGDAQPAGPQVLFSGLVPHDEVPDWLSAADLFVQPVYIEAASNSMKEALACGLPIVASDIPTIREFLDPSVATLVDPDDIHQIRNAIDHLIDNPDVRRAMGAAALEKAKSFRSRDRAAKILQWLDQI
jgi:glycosyltransferase involved in cell wall biosynthesis